MYKDIISEDACTLI